MRARTILVVLWILTLAAAGRSAAQASSCDRACLTGTGVDTVPMNFGPIDLQAAEIFKIRGGKIHEIEALGYLLPYNSKTGWEQEGSQQ